MIAVDLLFQWPAELSSTNKHYVNTNNISRPTLRPLLKKVIDFNYKMIFCIYIRAFSFFLSLFPAKREYTRKKNYPYIPYKTSINGGEKKRVATRDEQRVRKCFLADNKSSI